MQVRGALETLVTALTPINHGKGSSNEVQPALMNSDLLSRESESISLLINLLVSFIPELILNSRIIQISESLQNFFPHWGFVDRQRMISMLDIIRCNF